jgi:uncharacterized protein
MDDYVFSAPAQSGNRYMLAKQTPFCCHVSPVMKDGENADSEYYRQKFLYWKKNLFRDKYEYPNTMRLSPEGIKYNIINLQQLVFEVTDACNLRCKYCGYGDLYSGYDKRENKTLTVKQVQPLLDYLVDLWKTENNESFNKKTTISFYGGEPLINMPFIETIVHFFNSLNIKGRKFTYSMTTNSMLLGRYIDFIADNNFRLLVSLDGTYENNAYRLDASGDNSFSRIIKNVDLIKQKYPDYFEKHVNFNAVLHNKNSVAEVHNFIHQKYGKIPTISELNNSGILPEKQEEFNRLYKNWDESLHQSENYEALEQEMFMKSYSYKDATTFLHQYSGNVFRTYNSLLYGRTLNKFVPTGTCVPFSRKLFVTVNGKILPCERINHEFALGQIDKDKMRLDYEFVAQKYNAYYDKLNKQCSQCYHSHSCQQCIFYIENIEQNPVCHGYIDKDIFSKYFASNMDFLEKHREDYFRIMEEVVIE